MDEISILKGVLSQGPFAALFVWLLWSTKRDSREREQKLTEHLSRTTEAQEQMTRTMEKMQMGLSALELDLKDLSVEVRDLKRGN